MDIVELAKMLGSITLIFLFVYFVFWIFGKIEG